MKLNQTLYNLIYSFPTLLRWKCILGPYFSHTNQTYKAASCLQSQSKAFLFALDIEYTSSSHDAGPCHLVQGCGATHTPRELRRRSLPPDPELWEICVCFLAVVIDIHHSTAVALTTSHFSDWYHIPDCPEDVPKHSGQLLHLQY